MKSYVVPMRKKVWAVANTATLAVLAAAPAFAVASPDASIDQATANATAVTGYLGTGAAAVILFIAVLNSGKLLSVVANTGFKIFRRNS